MNLTDRIQNKIVILEVAGEVLVPKDAAMFHEKIRSYIKEGHQLFIVDLGQVDKMNSVGLGMLVSALAAVKKIDGKLVLANIDAVETILSLTRLITIFDSYASIDDALSATTSKS